MKFEKGNAGRPKGSKAKIDAQARKLFRDTIAAESVNLGVAFEKLRKEDNKAYLQIFNSYVKYFAPILTEANDKVEVEASEPFNIKDVLKTKNTSNPFAGVFEFTDNDNNIEDND